MKRSWGVCARVGLVGALCVAGCREQPKPSVVHRVADFDEDPAVSSGPKGLTVLDDVLYLDARPPPTPGRANQAWRITSLTAPPEHYRDASENLFTEIKAAHRGELFFMAASGGTLAVPLLFALVPGGRRQTIPPFNDAVYVHLTREFRSVGETLYFSGRPHLKPYLIGQGLELWKLPAGTSTAVQVADIIPGEGGAEPQKLTPLGEQLLFTADDTVTGRELWLSDGTAEGTVQVLDLRAGLEGSLPEALTVVGERLFFTADDGSWGRELWSSDGTAQGTAPVADLSTGKASTTFSELATLGGVLYFGVLPQEGADAAAAGLWRSGGTEGGTRLVVPASVLKHGRILGVSAALEPEGLLLLAVQPEGSDSIVLWTTRGTASSTQPLPLGELELRDVSSFTRVGDALYFVASGYADEPRTPETPYTVGELWGASVRDLVAHSAPPR